MHFINDIDNSWTLFLDRDGVINEEKHQDYIRNASEFIFYEGVLDAFKKLSQSFGRIIIVTNQRGIGRGFMTHQDLNEIHEFMIAAVTQTGGRIDRVYYAPDLDSEAIDRKPNIGMGLTAKTEFPDIDFAKSIMVGNNISDMKFGRGLGMHTVYVETTKPLDEDHESIDLKTESLVAFAAML